MGGGWQGTHLWVLAAACAVGGQAGEGVAPRVREGAGTAAQRARLLSTQQVGEAHLALREPQACAWLGIPKLGYHWLEGHGSDQGLLHILPGKEGRMRGWGGPINPKKGCLGMLRWVLPALMPSHPKGDRGQSPPTSSPFHGCPGELPKHPWHDGRDIKSMGIVTSPGTPEVWPYDPISHI